MKKRILSGMRPTGKLHVGHLYGALQNWVRLQDEYDCLYMVADWHALTTDYADTSSIQSNINEMVLDWLTVGIDPKKSIIFRQSQVPEHAELFLLLGMITPLGWLFRCPTYKEQLKEVKDKDLHTIGFLGYPVLQAADIMLYKADAVPVGEDQLPHIELTREMARRFNNLYGESLVEPKGLLTAASRVPGIDGRKMSKSYGNAVLISEDPDTVRKKVQLMFTDPKKIRANDLGHPEGCVVFAFHQIFNPESASLEIECKKGNVGCVACKKKIAELLVSSLSLLREKRQMLSEEKGLIDAVLEEGRTKASSIAKQTMEEIRRNIKIN